MDKTIEEQLVHLWGKVGFIVNLSQMVEYNLLNILAFDEKYGRNLKGEILPAIFILI